MKLMSAFVGEIMFYLLMYRIIFKLSFVIFINVILKTINHTLNKINCNYFRITNFYNVILLINLCRVFKRAIR